MPDLAQGQRFNLSQLAIGAALAGQGVAMGRTALVLEDLQAGRLVDLFGLHLPSEAAYYFVSAQAQSAQAAAIEAWLLAEGAAFRAERDRWRQGAGPARTPATRLRRARQPRR